MIRFLNFEQVMNRFYLLIFTAFVALFSLASGCKDDPKQTDTDKQGLVAAFQPDTLPSGITTGYVEFRDRNSYISGDYFCMVTLVDNKTQAWAEIWTRLSVLDSAGNVLKVKGDTSFVIRAFSKAVPPSGATALFCAVPLTLIAGTPADCRMEGAGVRYLEAGPILVSTESDGIRVQRPDPSDSTRVQEIAFNAYGTIENPLPLPVMSFHLVYLLYGKDNKLYFAQVIDPSIEVPSLHMEQTGPLMGGDKRKIHYSILYENLPKPLQDVLIGRLDLQAYEVR